MHPLEKEILKLLRQHRLLGPTGETMVVAVSGGPDSVSLLHILVRISEQLDSTLVAAYVNHGLRPAASAREAQFVSALAAKLGIAFASGEVDVVGHAQKHRLSIEHAGRLCRYGMLEEIAQDHHAARIALGHTADDQAEEILLRLLRGTGRKGLSGMLLLREGRFLRPLLTTPKARLIAYLDDLGAQFLEDSSNRERIFLRNKIRLDLLPYLARQFNPNVRRTILQTAAILQDEEELLAHLTRQACQEIIVRPFAGQSSETSPPEVVAAADSGQPLAPPDLCLDLDRFAGQPLAIRRRVLEEACWRMQCTPGFRQIEQLLALAAGGRTGARLHLGRGLRVNNIGRSLHFSYPIGMKSGRRGDLLPAHGPASFEISIPGPGRWPAAQAGLVLEFERLDELPAAMAIREPGCQYLDLAKIAFPLTLRSPRPGDRFRPLGSAGRKKVSDFLVDLKIARQRRWQIPILLSGPAIIALPGLRIDHDYRLTDRTTAVLRLRCTVL